MKKVLYVLLIIALVAAAAAGAYLYQQQRIDDLQSERDSLNSELDAARKANEGTDNNTNGDDQQANSATYTSEKGTEVSISSPTEGTQISSPLTVAGRVPGSWSSEGQFTIRLLDNDGDVIAEEPATLQGDWMTTSMVTFTATLTFDNPSSDKGSLVLVKANPSGLDENSDQVTVPVKF